MNIMIDPEWTWCLKCPRTQIAERLRPRGGSPAAGGERDGLQFNRGPCRFIRKNLMHCHGPPGK